MPKIGRKLPENTKSETQSVIFDINKWTISDAKEWLKEHDFERLIVDESEGYYRFRQYDPELFKRFITKDLGNGIKLIIGFVKETKKKSDKTKLFKTEIDFDAINKFMDDKNFPENIKNHIVNMINNFSLGDLSLMLQIFDKLLWDMERVELIKSSNVDDFELDFNNINDYMDMKGFDEVIKNLTIDLLSNFKISELMNFQDIFNKIRWNIDDKIWEEDYKNESPKAEPVEVFIKQESDREKNKKAQELRSKKYKIAIKENTNVTKPGKWSNLSDNEFADPVNYKYPIHNASHTRNAQARFSQSKDVYSSDEQKIIQDRIDKSKKKFKIGEFKKSVKLVKETLDNEKRLVYGVVIEPGNVDTDNEWTDEENIENACHTFMKYFQESGIDHEFIIVNGMKIVENFIAPTNFIKNGVMIKKGSWIMAHYVEDNDIWERIKSGDLDGYSFEGLGMLSNEKP